MIAKIYTPPIKTIENKETTQQTQITGNSFAKIFERELEDIKFSAHATKRLEQRADSLSIDEVNRLKNAVTRAANKGARDSLIFLNDLAFIVSVKNRVVVTAMDREGLRENVITNIDSAVIA